MGGWTEIMDQRFARTDICETVKIKPAPLGLDEVLKSPFQIWTDGTMRAKCLFTIPPSAAKPLPQLRSRAGLAGLPVP